MVKWVLLGMFVVYLGSAAHAERPFVQSPSEGGALPGERAAPASSVDLPSGASSGASSDASSEVAADDATLEFVRIQEPELAKLLGFMKTKRNVDYREAMEEIRRVRERLESLKKRDQELHEVELAIWRNAAQLRLWAASVSASSKKMSDTDRTKLTELLASENELTLKRLNVDRLRAEARLEQVKQQIAKREQTESVIAKGIKTWEGRIERPTNKSKNKAASAAPNQSPSTETP